MAFHHPLLPLDQQTGHLDMLPRSPNMLCERGMLGQWEDDCAVAGHRVLATPNFATGIATGWVNTSRYWTGRVAPLIAGNANKTTLSGTIQNQSKRAKEY